MTKDANKILDKMLAGDPQTRQLIQGLLACGRCDHHWWPRNPRKRPKSCPACNSPYWDRERKLNIREDRKARPKT